MRIGGVLEAYWRRIGGVLEAYRKRIRGVFGACSGRIRCVFAVYSGRIRGVFGAYSGHNSGRIRGVFMAYSGPLVATQNATPEVRRGPFWYLPRFSHGHSKTNENSPVFMESDIRVSWPGAGGGAPSARPEYP